MPVLSTAGAASAAGFGVPETFYPGRLFAAGEQGAWYDPSDLTTLFQDSAGTTPVTGVEQVVGLMKDKSGRGNHATSTGSARPTLSALVNLLTYTEQFDNAAWNKINASVSADTTTAPDGTTTADSLADTAANNYHYLNFTSGFTSIAASYTFSLYLKQGTNRYAGIHVNDGTARGCSIDLQTGTLGTPYGGATASVTSLSNSWYQLTVTATMIASASSTVAIYLSNSNSLAPYAGTGSTVYVWGADLRLTNDGVGIPSYQRVAAAGTYNTVGFPYYLLFSGAQGMSTPANVDFSGTDKATVWAGVRKLSDAARGMVVELNTTGTNDFKLSAPDTTGGAPYNNYGPRISGTIGSGAFYVLPFVAPITNVVSVAYNLSGATNPDQVSVTVNNVAQSLAGVGTSMTGNFSNAPLYIGARNYPTTPSLYLNGRLYGLIVRGTATSTDQLQKCVGWVNNKTKAY